MDQNKKISLLSWIILGIVGILTIILSREVEKVIYIIIGIALMLMAVVSVISCINGKNAKAVFKNNMLQIILTLIVFLAGLWIVINPTGFGKLLNIVIGLGMLVAGAIWLYRGIKLKDVFISVIGGIAVVFGIIIAVNHSATSGIIVAAGIGLIYTSICGIITQLRLK